MVGLEEARVVPAGDDEGGGHLPRRRYYGRACHLGMTGVSGGGGGARATPRVNDFGFCFQLENNTVHTSRMWYDLNLPAVIDYYHP